VIAVLNTRERKINPRLNSTDQKLKQDEELKGNISDLLAKEFKTPLVSMLDMLDLLLTTAMSLKQKEYLELACSSGRSLMSLIDSVLTFSSIKTGQIKLIEQECHLVEVLDEVIERLAEKALKKSINLGYVLAADIPEVVITDSVKLQKILVQLLDNAIKFTHFGEVSIYVEVDDKTQTICFDIKDKGIGIDERDHKKILSPFFQVDPASEKIYQGLGLGLTIANELAAIMEGQLSLISSLGRGSNFKLKVPVKLVQKTPPAKKIKR
jgi:signal transduction histidine kinase